jgi:lipoate-protein ligase B
MDECSIILPGILDYTDALNLQEEILKERINDVVKDTIILLEHPHVFTIGRRGKIENLLIPEEILNKNSICLYRVERGGDITYHGYGQLVGYPIIKLDRFQKNISNYVEKLQEVFIQLLKNEYNIDAKPNPNYPGVWVGQKKITSIGISAKKWVTYHGFAFNVNTDLNYFNMINPCGIKHLEVTSLKALLGRSVNMDEVRGKVIQYFKEVFGYK